MLTISLYFYILLLMVLHGILIYFYYNASLKYHFYFLLSLQANLATYGIETQTPKEIEPIVICAPQELVRVSEQTASL